MNIVAAFLPRRESPDLRKLLPGSFTIGPGRIKAAQFPDAVQDPATGQTHQRPDKWRASSKVTIPHSRDHSPQEAQPGM
ncbi:hypothetical protein [Streptomyces neyagawaensis]|uniref:Uncharacterized protein n=1 Tax=Streptomyces neyagawaensis TaxID=42238 RepID=A0ABV3B696_9ACTN